jgi:hypothetical protein
MKCRYLVETLILITIIFSISNLFADKAKRKYLASRFRGETDFVGIITWWDDDTMRELDGYFPLKPSYIVDYNPDTVPNPYFPHVPLQAGDNSTEKDIFGHSLRKNPNEDGDPFHYLNKTVNDYFQSIIRYSGLKNKDFTFWVDQSFDTYIYRQNCNGLEIENGGFIKINLYDEELSISLKTLPHVNAPLKPSINEADAYELFKTIADSSETTPQIETGEKLLYLANDNVNYSHSNVADLLLVWRFIGKTQTFYIDAMSGNLIKAVKNKTLAKFLKRNYLYNYPKPIDLNWSNRPRLFP